MPAHRLLPYPLLLLLLPACASAAPIAWRFDTVHTQIQFSVDHLGFAQALGLVKVGEGRLLFDPDDFSSASLDVSADLATLYLGDAKWEDTVKSWQFLNVKKWPVARFVSRSVQATGSNQGFIDGDLQLHGESQPMRIEFKLNKIGNDPYTFKYTAGFSASATLQRRAFGMDKLLSAVGDDVKLRIEVEVIRDRGDAPPQPGEDDSDANER